MDKFFVEIKKTNDLLSPTQQPFLLPQPPPQVSNLDSGNGFDLNSKVSPSILLIIIILAIIFFVSGLLHLLVRFLLRPPNRETDDMESVTALQGQLQQLFHLHDAGVDQSFIDNLPVFHYKAIIGLKNPFDCAVCLCEFEAEDKLRLLPKCSHAFHMECIDTWLLSHSTCPLCRTSLIPDFSSNNSCSPIVLVLESGSESSIEIVDDREGNVGRSSSVLTGNNHVGFQGEGELGSSCREISHKLSSEILTAAATKDESVQPPVVKVDSGEKVVRVKLGKFRNIDIGESSCSDGNAADPTRRCYSMGSFEYVMDENSSLQVPIRTPIKKQSSKKNCLPLTPGHRPAMSECDCESRREFPGLEGIRTIPEPKETAATIVSTNISANSIVRTKRESFSISKIWLRGRKENKNPTEDSSRRAVSFRFPVNKNIASDDDCICKIKNGVADDDDVARRANSEMNIGRWSNGQSHDVENQQSCYISSSLDSQAKTPSFARRTLQWLVGRQNKVVHSSFTPEV